MPSSPILWHPVPARAPNAPEVSPAEWEQHRELLKWLYLEKNKTLDCVMEYMKSKHDFQPTKRQYTHQLNNWKFFKNQSRHRSQRIGNHRASHLSEASSCAPSQSGLSAIDIHTAATTSCDVEKDENEESSTAVSHRLAESTSDIPVAKYNLSEVQNTMEDSASSKSLVAVISETSTGDEVSGRLSTQASRRSSSDGMLPDELFEDSIQASVCATQNTAKPRPLSIIEEEQPTPALSEASRLSAKASTSIDTKSISSFGSSSDNVHLLMDIDQEDTSRLPVMNSEEFIQENRMQFPGQLLEESIARLSKVHRAEYGPDTGVVDPKAKMTIPVLVQLAQPTSTYSLSKVLSKIRQYRTRQSITVAGLNQITSIADFLSAARSYPDAFRLYRFIFDRIVDQTDCSLSPLDLYLACINVMRTATSAENHKDIAGLMKNIMSKRKDFLSPSTIEACVLHSHLGNNFRARNDLEAAERHCRLGLECYRRYHNSSNTPASRIILATNFLLVQEAKRGFETTEATQDLLQAGIIYQHTLRITIEDTLLALLYWCREAIMEADLLDLGGLIHGCKDEFWSQGSASDLSEFETTLLFCHLWKRWQLAGKGSQMSMQRHNLHPLLAELQISLGIAPVDTLAALSIMIIGSGGSEDHRGSGKWTLLGRIFLRSQAASLIDRTTLYSQFLSAHTAPLRTKFKCFSTDQYTTMVGEFVQGFADLHFHLHLPEAAFQYPELRVRPNRSSSTPSMTPTTLSTPRSSWSGYAAFKLTSRSAKLASLQAGSDMQLVTSSLQRPSTSSSSLRRRLSLSGSFSSFRSSRSYSFVNDPEDVVMEDVI